ncbi:MAG: sigma-70 family RNA polymerase sigma factor [Ardenticatenia bacterium]|nr:sigma-70 family RNA polymerase sigma factor [Ardenticatenia bacterium]
MCANAHRPFDEDALVSALRRGDRRACDDLVRHYAPKLYNVALRLVGRPDEAEDVLQETFIAACEKIKDFKGHSRLGTWLYRIVTNNGLMYLRRRRPTVPLDEVEEASVNVHPRLLQKWPDDPASAVDVAELRAAMEQAIAELPETLRLAFVLRDIEGLSTREAAEVLGISPTALKVRLHRARLLLRERLAEYFTTVRGGSQ